MVHTIYQIYDLFLDMYLVYNAQVLKKKVRLAENKYQSFNYNTRKPRQKILNYIILYILEWSFVRKSGITKMH